MVSVYAASTCACAEINAPPAPDISVTQIGQFDRAPKSPACAVPMVYVEPLSGFKKIAIVEGWGTEEQRTDVVAALDKKACELGADLLLVVADTAQHTTKLVYDPANEEPGAEDDSSLGASKAQKIDDKEHIAKIGEKGHSGYYIETYVLVSTDTKK